MFIFFCAAAKIEIKPLLFPNWDSSLAYRFRLTFSIWFMKTLARLKPTMYARWQKKTTFFSWQKYIIFLQIHKKRVPNTRNFLCQFPQMKYVELYFMQQEFIVRINPVDIVEVSFTTNATRALQRKTSTLLMLSNAHFFCYQSQHGMPNNGNSNNNNIFPLKSTHTQKLPNKGYKREVSGDFSNVYNSLPPSVTFKWFKINICITHNILSLSFSLSPCMKCSSGRTHSRTHTHTNFYSPKMQVKLSQHNYIS